MQTGKVLGVVQAPAFAPRKRFAQPAQPQPVVQPVAVEAPAQEQPVLVTA